LAGVTSYIAPVPLEKGRWSHFLMVDDVETTGMDME
jgi:hypothetical protein